MSDWVKIKDKEPPRGVWLEFFCGLYDCGDQLHYIDKVKRCGKDCVIKYLHNYTHWRELSAPHDWSMEKAKKDKDLCDASEKGDINSVRCLLDGGADVSYNHDAPLVEASLNGHADVVRVLLNYGANARAQDDKAICWASDEGHEEVVKILIEAGSYSDYALKMVADRGRLGMVKILLPYASRAGVDDALIAAIKKARNNVIRVLLEAGANPSSKAVKRLDWSGREYHVFVDGINGGELHDVMIDNEGDWPVIYCVKKDQDSEN